MCAHNRQLIPVQATKIYNCFIISALKSLIFSVNKWHKNVFRISKKRSLCKLGRSFLVLLCYYGQYLGNHAERETRLRYILITYCSVRLRHYYRGSLRCCNGDFEILKQTQQTRRSCRCGLDLPDTAPLITSHRCCQKKKKKKNIYKARLDAKAFSWPCTNVDGGGGGVGVGRVIGRTVYSSDTMWP